MYLDKGLRVIPISFVLVLGLLLPTLIVTPIVNADPTGEQITFYFKDVFGLEESPQYDSATGMSVLVSQDHPTKQNDSEYPPMLFNGHELNTDALTAWFSTWMFYLFDMSNLTGDDGFGGLLKGLEILFPNPYRIVETYENNGNKSIEINGDVVYNLYFSPDATLKSGNSDKVEIGMYFLNSESLLPLPQLLNDTTAQLSSAKLLKRSIYEQEIKLENINYTLNPGGSLLFSIELIPSNKTIVNTVLNILGMPFVESCEEKLIDFFIAHENNDNMPVLQEIGALINETISMTQGLNLTKEDIAQITNAMMSSSLIYDSIDHPSSVTLPVNSSSSEEENTKVYYLHGNEMNQKRPTNSTASSANLLGQSKSWNAPDLSMSKILKNASANLYVKYKDYNLLKNKIKITVSLLCGDIKIASSEIELDKTLDSPLTSPTVAKIFFSFGNLDNYEISYGNHLNLQISTNNNTRFNMGLLRSVELLYDSSEYPSSLTLDFGETDHIKMNVISNPAPADRKIVPVVPGDSINYTLDVTSDFADKINVTISGFSEKEKENWDIEIIPESFSISKNGTKTTNIIVTSNNSAPDGAKLEVTFVTSGNTGKDTFNAAAEISEDAVKYNIHVTVPLNRTIKHGENDTYHFLIRNENTGIWSDDYIIEATSEHGWNLSYEKNVNGLYPGDEHDVEVTLHVPRNTNITSDKLIFTVTSEKSSGMSVTVNVTTTIIGPTFLEKLYGFFESTAKGLGLDGIFGFYAPHFLAAILLIIIFIIIIILILLFTSKYANIICLERIKEISPDTEARFGITIKNPTKKPRNYELSFKEDPESSKWIVSLNLKKIVLEPGQSKVVFLTVKPTDIIEREDWVKINVVVNTEGKKRLEKIATMTMIKEAKTELSLSNVFHWPRAFKEGDRVTSSFKLDNKGNISASNISVVLYVNGMEKNKVDNIIIPAGGYADIKVPWIAVKGKNEINIVVR